ncbi:carboxypeptidase regulatory-like domain-containing protein [Undibacterium sp. Ji42W]|uniref:carboxypeptidase regulatory-like domain-containing protein n=1 Tax=Undibacterium sp. Ji42W TaxID=3413039 RepID=UPI003BEFC35C
MFTLLVHGAYAQTTVQVSNGLQWLNAQVQADGKLTGEAQSIATPLQTRAEVAQTLKLLATLPASLASSIAADAEDNTEYLARKIISLGANGWDPSNSLNLLLARQGVEGGFGGAPYYSSNVVDTAWAVLALAQTKGGTSDAANRARAYLVTQLASDGGASGPNDWNRKYNSAIILLALQTVSDGSNTTIVRALASWLQQQQASNGSWSGNTYLTALVMTGIVPVTTDAAVLTNALNFLVSKQGADGSWSTDPFLTALVLRVLSGQAGPPGSAGVLQGQLVDNATNVPLSGSTVTLSGTSNQVATTDVSGRFAFNGLASGNYSVTYSRVGYTSKISSYSAVAGQISDAGIVKLTQLAGTGIIRGQVTATNGSTLSGVTMSLSGAATLNATSDANGRYEFVVPSPGAFAISASLTGYKTASSSGTVAAGQTVLFAPVLYTNNETTPGTIRFTGKVVSAGQNTPLAGVAIQIGGAANSNAVTTANGQFDQTLNPGSYSATFSLSGYTSITQIFTASAGSVVDAGTVTLMPVKTSTSIKGKVVNTSNAAIAGASVQIVGMSNAATTAVDGSYSINNIAGTSFSVRSSAVGYNSQTINLQVSAPSDLVQNFSLAPQTASVLSIGDLIISQTHYGAYKPVAIQINVRNTSTETRSGSFKAAIVDAQGQIVGNVDATWTNAQGGLVRQFDFPPGDTSLTIPWSTNANAPGAYTILGTVSTGTAGGLENIDRQASIVIDPTTEIGSVTVSPKPRFANVGETKSIQFGIDVFNRSNVPVSTDVAFQLQTPGGNVIYSGTSKIDLLPSDASKSLVLTGTSYTFAQSGSHPILVQALNGPTPATVMGGTIVVAPGIRIEMSQELTPSVVTPDGNKRIRTDILLKGVESK